MMILTTEPIGPCVLPQLMPFAAPADNHPVLAVMLLVVFFSLIGFGLGYFSAKT